ncbi:MAG: hypothetical protein QME88_10045 [Actinomycetota bacterium]|nr:hypothetical protein [Actinomycetota bacterium]
MEESDGGLESEVRREGPPRNPGTGGRRRAVLRMSLALAVLVVVAGLMSGIYAWRFLAAARELTVGDIDPSGLPDGVYTGSHSFFHVKAAVEVEVEGGRVKAIALIDAGRMAEETREDIEGIFERVVSAQSLDVDLESGASVSKKVSLKAVESALSAAGD